MKRNCLLVFLSLVASMGLSYGQKNQFTVSIDPSVAENAALSGNLYILMSKDTSALPIYGPDFIDPAPFFLKKVNTWKTTDTLLVETPDAAYPVSLNEVPEGVYAIQAVFDINTVERSFAFASGNLYSHAVVAAFKGEAASKLHIHLNQRMKDRKFEDTGNVKGVRIKSELMSRFYNRPAYLEAAVILPPSYQSGSIKKYPVVYVIPGFGGTHYNNHLDWVLEGLVRHAQQEKLYVVLNPESPLGHHAFADSQNNGPVAKALIQELFPYVERKYPAHAVPQARFLFGHSSGGWSSLWLMVNYPDYFGGAWSTSPDPIDFRSFFKINLYDKEANAFNDENGKPRTLERIPVETKPTYKQLSDREVALGDGEQYGSFEAVFSSRGTDGRPQQLWDRKTGRINVAVAKAWQNYDISLKLKRLSKEHLQKLNDKIHIYVGDQDTYYLDHAVRMFNERSKNLVKSSVKFYPGHDHYSILNKEVYEDIERSMNNSFNKIAEAKK